jgi:hypothetical protein
VLPSIGFSYYSVNDEVYFIDLIKTGQDNTSNCPIRVRFNNERVYHIALGSFNSSVIDKGSNLLFVLHPGKIGFYKFSLK